MPVRLASPRGRAVSSAVGVALVGVFPAFLVGGLAVQLQDDLAFDDTGLGVASAAFFLGGAVASAAAGGMAERWGPTVALRRAAAAATVLLVVTAASARSWVSLVACLAVAGVVNALAQPAANLVIAREVSSARLGFAFALKQSAIPLAGVLSGLAVPALALTVGWRWAFVAAALLGVLVAASVPRLDLAVTSGGSPRPSLGARPAAMAGLVVTAAFGAAAAGTIGSFLVRSGVEAGLDEGPAGLLLTGGSAFGIAVRLGAGRRADRRGRRHLPVVSAMLAGGVVGYALLAVGASWSHVVAVPFAFGLGWAWPGLFNLAVVRNNPDAPARSTGITQTGIYAGAVLGPVAFGVVADRWGFGPAWALSASWSLIAALGALVARRSLLAVRSSDRPLPSTRP